MTEAGAPIKLIPCPFCGGPPVPFVENYMGKGPAPEQADYGDEGLLVEAHVWCHECGAKGPHTKTKLIYSFEDYLEIEREGVDLWQAHGSTRNIDCYQGGEAEGLSLYPRPDRAESLTKLIEEVRLQQERDLDALMAKHRDGADHA